MTPPALTRIDTEYGDVQRLVLDALNIIRSDNFDPYFDLFTDDAVWMMPSSKTDVHKEEARGFYRFTAKFRFDQQAEVEELVVNGEWAFARISFDGYLRAKRDPDAVPIRSVSRHLWVLQQQLSGDWKIVRDIWNNPRDNP